MIRSNIFPSAFALIATLALVGCGGSGGSSSDTGSGSGSSGGSGGSSAPSSAPGSGSSAPTASTVETCDGGNLTGATSITPCVTITGLTSGQSITVSDGVSSLTETANGTVNFPKVAFVSGPNGVLEQPALTFSLSQGSTSCKVDGGLLASNTGVFDSNLASGGTVGAHLTVLCAGYPAAAVPLPNVTALPGVTATVVTNPQIVPVVFSGTANQANDVSFVTQLAASKVWGLLAQYGVGAATVTTVQTAAQPAFPMSSGNVITAADMSSLLSAQATTLDHSLTNNSVFVFFLPPGLTVTYPNGSLTELGQPNAAGYNGQVIVGSTTVTYALVPDTTGSFYQSDSVIYEMAEIALVDAVTNPSGSNGYAFVSSNPDVWLGASVAKLSDLMTSSPSAGSFTTAIGTLCASAGQTSYADITVGEILPIWSQVDAAAGRSPCQPNPVASNNGTLSSTLSDASTPFYGVVPQGLSTVTSNFGGIARTDAAVIVAPGQSVTVNLTFFSTAPMSTDVAVTPSIVSYISDTDAGSVTCTNGIGAQPVIASGCTLPLTVSAVTNVTRPDAGSSANNGDTVQVTITAGATAFSGEYVLQFGNGQLFVPLAVANTATVQ